MATTDPKASSMMMIAAVMPMPSLEPGAADTTLSAGAPPTATGKPGRAKPSAVWITSIAAELGRFTAVVSNWTTANPVLSSADSWRRPPGASGLVTDDTCGSVPDGGHQPRRCWPRSGRRSAGPASA